MSNTELNIHYSTDGIPPEINLKELFPEDGDLSYEEVLQQQVLWVFFKLLYLASKSVAFICLYRVAIELQICNFIFTINCKTNFTVSCHITGNCLIITSSMLEKQRCPR